MGILALVAVGITAICAVVCACFIITLKNERELPDRHVIAHAGGSIGGHYYTNSLEAVNNAISSGLDHIELDLRLTVDSALVAVHDWRKYRQMCGLDGAAPMSYAEFMRQRPHGTLHPLSAAMIDSIFAANPQLTLVTDMTDDIDVLRKSLPSLRGRMIVECFSDESFYRVKNSGWAVPMRHGFNNRIAWDSDFDYGYVIDKDIDKSAWLSSVYFVVTRCLGYPVAVFKAPPVTKAFADSLMHADPYVRYVYVDDF